MNKFKYCNYTNTHNFYFDNMDTDIDTLIGKLNNIHPNEILEIIKLFELDIKHLLIYILFII